jgi:hypothetical protein
MILVTSVEQPYVAVELRICFAEYLLARVRPLPGIAVGCAVGGAVQVGCGSVAEDENIGAGLRGTCALGVDQNEVVDAVAQLG